MCFGVVDVRDVADLHLRAMTVRRRNERFLAVAGDFMWMVEIARALKARWVKRRNVCRRGNCRTGW